MVLVNEKLDYLVPFLQRTELSELDLRTRMTISRGKMCFKNAQPSQIVIATYGPACLSEYLSPHSPLPPLPPSPLLHEAKERCVRE